MQHTTPSTSLLEIRDFLRSHHSAPLPWDPPQRVIDRLYSTLSERQRDERFWLGLRSLVGRLEDGRFDADAFAALELGQREQLIDALRASLGAGDGGGLRGWLCRPIGTAALLGLLLLGASTVASAASAQTKAAATLDDEDDADEMLDPADVEAYVSLTQMIDAAGLSAGSRNGLLECLPELDAAYRAQLLEKFQLMSEVELAAFLADMENSRVCREAVADDAKARANGVPVPTCSCGDDDDDDDDDDDGH